MSYSNYSSYLKYKNCCRPIGDTGPPGPTGPEGPTITGNRGDIIYFSETDNLVSTNNIFIQEGNVTVNNNLIVTGITYLNNTLEVSGNVIINGNLSMSDQFINDVSGIFFSDGTYIGLGSSFDITTSERLDISAAGGVTLTGNLTIDGATTITGNLNFSSTERISSSGSTTTINSGQLTIDAPTIIDNTLTIDGATTITGNLDVSGNVIINGNLSMSDQFINDVSGIYFSDATYIGHGSSFDITTSERLDISAAGGINLNTDVTINSNITINSNLTANTIHTQRLLFPGGNYIDYEDGVGELYVNGNTIINGNLSMNDNFINDVSGIYFTKGNLLFSDFSSVNQSIQLPSSQGQPISLERKTLFYDPNFNSNIPGNSSFIIDFSGSTIFNQLKLNVNGNIIEPSPDISGQYIEIYANFDVSSNSSPSKTFSLDITSVSGASFLETIDVRSITKQGSFYLTFGPHIFIPSQWENTNGFNFVIVNTTSSSFFINSYKLMFKSYFM